MSQESDDSIEKFFRKAVSQQDKTFLERDWANLERMLDEQAMSAAAARNSQSRQLVRASTFIFLLLSLLYVAGDSPIRMRPSTTSISVNIAKPEVRIHNLQPISRSEANSNSNIENSKENTVTKKRNGGNTRPQAKNSSLLSLTTNASLSSAYIEEKIMDDGPNTLRSEASKEYGRESPVGITSEAIASAEHAENENEKLDSLIKEQSNLEVGQPSKASKDKNAYHSSRLQVSAFLSPDFSSTQLGSFSTPSKSIGLTIGYHFFKRWTVVAGISKGVKQYSGYGNEYAPPEGYWQYRTNGIVPDEIKGECGIVEVPLMLQYDILQKLKSRIFISAGLSSYFMRSENYQYTFRNPNPGAADSWTAKEPTQYLFKIGHLSAGYDRLVTKRVSVGIEPFVKLPFEGIGWTDIRLYSTGAYINLRYSILDNPR